MASHTALSRARTLPAEKGRDTHSVNNAHRKAREPGAVANAQGPCGQPIRAWPYTLVYCLGCVV